MFPLRYDGLHVKSHISLLLKIHTATMDACGKYLKFSLSDGIALKIHVRVIQSAFKTDEIFNVTICIVEFTYQNTWWVAVIKMKYDEWVFKTHIFNENLILYLHWIRLAQLKNSWPFENFTSVPHVVWIWLNESFYAAWMRGAIWREIIPLVEIRFYSTDKFIEYFLHLLNFNLSHTFHDT